MARRKGRPPSPEVLEKERLAVALRREGKTWQMIAAEIGYQSASGAAEAYARASARVVAEGVSELRQLEADRLDLIQVAFWDRALEGDLRAGEMVLRVMERRAKLLGLDTPPQKIAPQVIPYTTEAIEYELALLYAATRAP